MANKILQIIKVDAQLMEEVKSSFNDLPETDHDDGHYRLRKYLRVTMKKEHLNNYLIKPLDDTTFKQSKKYNTHQGGKVRKFKPIDSKVIKSNAMYELLRAFYDACELDSGVIIDIHQIRVLCQGGATQMAPEGWHQDGYNCVTIIGIERCNIIGGELMASDGKTNPPFMEASLDSGTMLIVNDDYLWHNARTIQPIDDNKPAYFDSFIFTAKQ
jgi:hypothetical protein|tara:strand:- start:384 stop:1025 length:642 start_codon:yes stop_codon:yes gene_type:complete